MSQLKALLVDYDDTLVALGEPISQNVVAAIHRLPETVRFSVVTGRPFHGPMHALFRSLDQPGPHVVSNGALIMHGQTEAVLWSHPIDPAEVTAILKRLAAENRELIIDEGAQIYSNVADPSRITHVYDYRPIEQLPNRAVAKISILTGPHLTEADRLLTQLEHAFPNLRVGKWYLDRYKRGGVDIARATKLEGVAAYLELMGLHRDEIVVVGDGYNDFPLLMAAGTKIAMGNAVDELKAIADWVAPSVDQDGLVAVIEKYFL